MKQKTKEKQLQKGESDELFKKKVLAEEKINGKLYPLIFNYLVNSLNTGYAPVIAIAGRYGVGKSMTALRIAEVLHNEIGVLKGELSNPQDHLCYDVLNFLQNIKGSKRKAILFDDAGINLNSLDYHSPFNRAVVDSIASQRYRENPYIFILGKLYKLTKGIRDVIDLRLVLNKNKNDKPVASATIFRPRYGKINSGGRDRSAIYLSENYKPELPDKELIKKYREKERGFKEDLIDERIKEVKKEKGLLEEEEEKNKVKDAGDII